MKCLKVKLVLLFGLFTAVICSALLAQQPSGTEGEGVMRGDFAEVSEEWALALNTATDMWLDAEIEAEIDAELEAELDWEQELNSDIDWLEIDEDEWDWDLELEIEDEIEWDQEVDYLFLDSEEERQTRLLEDEVERDIEASVD